MQHLIGIDITERGQILAGLDHCNRSKTIITFICILHNLIQCLMKVFMDLNFKRFYVLGQNRSEDAYICLV